MSSYLDDGLGEVHPSAQQAVKVLPLLLQHPQLLLQLTLGLLVPHGEELPAHLQRVDERALIPLEQQLCVLRWKVGETNTNRRGRSRRTRRRNKTTEKKKN